MAKFKKSIVSAGTYLVGNDQGGRHTEVLSPERLLHWAKQFRRMKKAGIAIPAPWSHTKEALPVQTGNDGSVPRSDWNAGFWDELLVEPNDKGIATLYGTVEAPGDPEDPNTPAGKIGKTVKETSIYARPKFVDGKGNVYEDAIMHAALVTLPIEPGQENFEEVKDGLTIAMSHCTGLLMSADSTPFSKKGTKEDQFPGADDDDDLGDLDEAPTGDLKTLIELLGKIGIILPKDTTTDNFNERLSVSLQQKIAGEDEEDEEDGSLTKPPKEADKESEPMIMSTTTTPAAVTSEVIMAHPAYKALESQNQQLFGVMNTQARQARGARINSLIRSGRITKEYADTHLVPLLTSFKMSFDGEGKETLSALDITLSALEAQPAPTPPAPAPGTAPQFKSAAVAQLAPFLMSSIAPDGSDTPNHPIPGFHTGGLMTDEEADKVGDAVLANLGL